MDHVSEFVINHWALWLALFVILLLIYINEWFSKTKGPKLLSPQAVIAKINHEEAVVIDLRDKETFSSGHIIHAIQTTADDFNLPRMEKYKTKSIILVCARGTQSSALAAKIKNQGFTNAMILDGGITAWQNAGLPLVKGKS
jgi:rhodanese-related sulfurtransferase